MFNSLPTNLHNKVCEKIVYKQPTVLMDEIKTSRFADNFYEIQMMFFHNLKKISGFTDTLAVMRK
jgi:hypothetical protein